MFSSFVQKRRPKLWLKFHPETEKWKVFGGILLIWKVYFVWDFLKIYGTAEMVQKRFSRFFYDFADKSMWNLLPEGSKIPKNSLSKTGWCRNLTFFSICGVYSTKCQTPLPSLCVPWFFNNPVQFYWHSCNSISQKSSWNALQSLKESPRVKFFSISRQSHSIMYCFIYFA